MGAVAVPWTALFFRTALLKCFACTVGLDIWGSKILNNTVEHNKKNKVDGVEVAIQLLCLYSPEFTL